MARKMRLVRQAISELPGESREVVPLFAAGCEYHEITGMLGITDSAVRSLVGPAGKWPS
jgi:DNA-directed RNA polymerase specialized sigma24 family protein